MKQIIQTFLIIISANCFSQQILDTDNSRESNLYIESLKIYCDSLEKSKIKTVYVEYNYQIMDHHWPKKIGEFNIEYLENGEFRREIKKNNGSIIIVRILPLQFKREMFFVSLIPLYATYKNRKVNLSNGYGFGVRFEFDSEKKGFIYKDSKSYGL